jgi:hypothetical protein
MKKQLVLILTLLLLVTVCGTAFAGPFADVPSNHWTYNAVSSLAKAGIVDGYNAETFKGDHTITRYEMAMIVAKAMERSDKADAGQKALIDKLSTEFSAELKIIGVRLAKLEAKNQVKISGDFMLRAAGDRPGPNFSKYQIKGNDGLEARFRLWVMGDINDHTNVLARINTMNWKYGYGTMYANGTAATNPTFQLDLASVTEKNVLGFDKIRVGRQWAEGPGYTFMVGAASNMDGIYVEKKLNDVVTWKGSYYATGSYPYAMTTQSTTNDHLSTTAFVWKSDPQLEFSAGYWWAHEKGWGGTSGATTLMTTSGSYDSNDGFVIGFNKDFSKKFHLMGEYGATRLNNAVGLPSSPKAYMLQISNVAMPMFYPAQIFMVDAKKDKPGTSAWALSYRSVEPGATASSQQPYLVTSYSYQYNTPYDVELKSDNNTNLTFVYENVLEKNLLFLAEYMNYNVKNMALTNLTSKHLDQTYKIQFTWFWN